MMNALKTQDTVAFSEIVKNKPSYRPLASQLWTMHLKTSIHEVLKLVEMVADDEPQVNG